MREYHGNGLQHVSGSDCVDIAASKVDLLEASGEFTELDGHTAHQFFVIDESGIY